MLKLIQILWQKSYKLMWQEYDWCHLNNIIKTKFGYKLGYSLRQKYDWCHLNNKIWIKFEYKFSCSLRLQFPFKKKMNMTTYFENLNIGLYILYALHTHVKFCIN